MFRKIALATATAGVVALTGLGATTTAVSAEPYHHHDHYKHHRHRVCHPVSHYVKWFDRHGHPHWRKVVNMKCTFRWY